MNFISRVSFRPFNYLHPIAFGSVHSAPPPSYAPCSDDIKWCLYSMSDNNSFLRCNRFPVDAMIEYLKAFFDPEKPEEG